jgi:hypothetical protein
MHCHLRSTSPHKYVNPDVEIPFDVDITNWSPFSWGYSTAEYSYALFDAHNRYVPGGIRVEPVSGVPGSPHWVQVDQCTSVRDGPPHGVFLNYKPGPVKLRHWYRLVIYFRCHCCSFWLYPVLEANGDGADTEAAKPAADDSASLTSAPATILVSLPAGAALTTPAESPASAQPPTGEYRFRIENHITNDVRVGIFGFTSDATFRRTLRAGGHYDGDDHLYLLSGDRMIVVWDVDNMGTLAHYKKVTISSDIKIKITASGIVVGPY